MSKKKLFDDDSEGENISFQTQSEYAKKYNVWREKEEFHKLEQKYGSKSLNSDPSGSSDSEDDSDEPPEVSEEMETQFLTTLALLKKKDPRIYDPNYNFFKEEEKEKEKKPKVNTLSFADSDDEDDNNGDIFKVEKVAEIKKEAIPITKKTSKKVTEDSTLKDYLMGKSDHVKKEIEKELAPLKALWSDPKLNEGEAFLRDYILNKRYLEEGDAGEAEDKIHDDEDLQADEQTVEEQAKFERAYNFRFEEPDEEYLKRFPRTMNSIRPKDQRRAQRRAEVRARKDLEKQRKMDEIARLKAYKLAQLQEKMATLKQVTGNAQLAFKDEDIEGDFDPEEHDRRMRAIFDEEYYGEADDQKPVFPDLDEELEIENWEKYQKDSGGDKHNGNDDEMHCEDEEFNMDAEYDPTQARANLLEEIKSNLDKKRRNRKRKSKLAKLLDREKPKYVPNEMEKSYAQHMDEYYGMDCEDVIGGDLPTRFKYREVAPNDYGLTVEEILLADDKELTQWVPLKKIVKHRPDEAERGDRNTYAKRAADLNLKRKILPSLFKQLPQEPELVVQRESKKKKKKNNNEKTVNESQDEQTNADEPEQEEVKNKSKKKKRKHEEINGESVIPENNEGDIESDNKKSKKQKNDDTKNVDNSEIENQEGGELKKRKQNTEENHVELDNRDNGDVTRQKKKKKDKTEDNHVELDNKDNGDVTRKKKDKTEEETKQTKGKSKKIKNKATNKYSKLKKKAPKSNDNNISDERLKAFGLNPKKYRGFLKYKKF